MNLNAEAKSAICSNISKGYAAASFSYNLTQSEIAGIDQFIDRQYSQIPNNANLTINVQMQFGATVQFVNSLDEITDGNAEGDAIQVLADEISPRAVNLNGFSLPGKNTTVHDFLHLDGATDLYKYKKGVLVKSDPSIFGGNNSLLTPTCKLNQK